MEYSGTTTKKLFKRRFGLIFLLLLIISCGTRNNNIIIEENIETESTDIIDYSLIKLFSQSGYSIKWEVSRRFIDPYPSVSMDYDIVYSFPDKIKMFGNSYENGNIFKEIIAISNSEFHKNRSVWEEFPRSEFTNINFQIELILLKKIYKYIGKIINNDTILVFSFQPNLPLIDPLEKIISTGEIYISKNDSLPLKIVVYSPDSMLFWQMQFSDFGIRQSIISPRSLNYQYNIDFSENNDIEIFKKRLENLDCDNIVFSRNKKTVSFNSILIPKDFLDLILSKGELKLSFGEWVDYPQEFINNDSALFEIYGEGSFLDFVGGVPYRVVAVKDEFINIYPENIESSEIITDASGRIGLKVIFNTDYWKTLYPILQNKEGLLITLYIDNYLVSVFPLYSQHVNSLTFPWERENIYNIEFINAIINSSSLLENAILQ